MISISNQEGWQGYLAAVLTGASTQLAEEWKTVESLVCLLALCPPLAPPVLSPNFSHSR